MRVFKFIFKFVLFCSYLIAIIVISYLVDMNYTEYNTTNTIHWREILYIIVVVQHSIEIGFSSMIRMTFEHFYFIFSIFSIIIFFNYFNMGLMWWNGWRRDLCSSNCFINQRLLRINRWSIMKLQPTPSTRKHIYHIHTPSR